MISRSISKVGRTYREAFQGLPRDVWVLSFILLVNRSGAMVVPFLALYFTAQLGFDKTVAGYFLGAYGLGAVFGSMLGGYLTVRIGSKPVQWWSLFLTAIGFLVLGQLTSFWPIAICLFSLSVVSEAMRPANSTAITELSPRDKYRQSLALNRLAANLGMSIGPTLGGFLAAINYQWLFVVDAATCGMAGVLILVYFRGGGLPKFDQQDTPQKQELAAGPLSDVTFLIFWVLIFLTAMVFFQLIATFPIYLHEKFGMIEWQIGLALALNTVVIVLIEMPIVKALESANALRVIGWGCFFSCLGFGILPYGYGFAFCLFTIWVWTMGEILAMPISLAFTAERSNDHNRGWYMGSYTMCYAAAFVLAPIAGTWIYQINPELVWHISLGIGFLVWIGFRLLDRYDRKTRLAETANWRNQSNGPEKKSGER